MTSPSDFKIQLGARFPVRREEKVDVITAAAVISDIRYVSIEFDAASLAALRETALPRCADETRRYVTGSTSDIIV